MKLSRTQADIVRKIRRKWGKDLIAVEFSIVRRFGPKEIKARIILWLLTVNGLPQILNSVGRTWTEAYKNLK